MEDLSKLQTNAAVASALTLDAAATNFEPACNGQFAALPDGHQIHDLEEYQTRPNRMKVGASCRSIDSLIGYVNHWGDNETSVVIFPERFSIRATIDYGDPKDGPGHKQHVMTFTGQISPELKPWLDLSGKPIAQAALAEFLEDHAAEIAIPEAAAIMDMVLTFEAVKKVSFRSGIRLANGDRQLTYSEETQGAGTSGSDVVPDSITIHVPLFDSEPAEDVRFRLRYRIDEGRLSFTLLMQDRERMLREAFSAMSAKAGAEISSAVPRPFITA